MIVNPIDDGAPLKDDGDREKCALAYIYELKLTKNGRAPNLLE
jgi:hypothetical protein